LSLHVTDGWTTVQVGSLPAEEEATKIELALPEGGLRGSLLRREEAVGAQLLRLVAASDGTVKATALTLADGSFAVPFLPPGVYSLLAGERPIRTFQIGLGSQEDFGVMQLDGAPRHRP
jgi:hypothetical protein